MLSEAKFYGGAKFTTIAGSVQLADNSERVQTFLNTSGASRDVSLPRDLPLYHRTVKGGLWFVILLSAASSQQVRVRYYKDPSTFTLCTLNPGQCAYIWMGQTSADWVCDIRTIGTARDLTNSASAGITQAATEASYNPFCYEGDDCGLAQANPLNGSNGTDVVLAAMFQDMTKAQNQGREAIRAADVVMPDVIILKLTQACFQVDPLHPNTKTLSPEFYTSLFNDGNPHVLSYVPQSDSGYIDGLTRNPYHMAWIDDFPSLGFVFEVAQSVYRRYWRKTINYSANGTQYSIEIRFTMEQAMTGMPVFDRCGGGGRSDTNSGAWGALFHVSVFATEIMPTWVEGNAWQPYGSSDATLTFTKNDPFVNGPWHGVDTLGEKFCHPQMAMFAMLPMTWHSPLGRAWVPLNDRAFYQQADDSDPNAVGTGRAHNREKAYNYDNGAPWTTQFPYEGTTGTAFNNIVFGHSITQTYGRPLSLGGHFPRSKPMEWLCWENGLGAGTTFFKPLKPGWNEAVGILDILNGNCGSITIPINCFGEIDSEGPSSTNRWHLDPHPCLGHPDEPFEDYGGSHTCFNNFDGGAANGGSGDTTRCCISLTFQQAECRQQCTRNFTVTDADCNVITGYCENTAWFWATRSMPLEDYTYVANGNQLNRSASWKRILPNPDQVDYSYAFDTASTSDLVQELGTWDLSTATIKMSGVSGSNSIRSAVLYEPASWVNNRDAEVSATAKKIKQKSHVLLVKALPVFGVIRGYGLNVVPVTPGAGSTTLTVQLVKYKADGTKVVLATATTASTSSEDCDMVLEAWGTDLTASVTPSGGATTTLTAWDKDFANGWCGLATESTSGTNAWFDLFAIEDKSVDFLDITASVGPNTVSVAWPEPLTYGYGQCNTSTPPCGVPPYCACTTWYDTKYQLLNATKVTNDRDFLPRVVTTSCTGGDNPTWYGNGNPACCEYTICSSSRLYSCSVCPGSFPALSFSIVQRCDVPKDYTDPSCEGYVENKPRMCSGLTYWNVIPMACS